MMELTELSDVTGRYFERDDESLWQVIGKMDRLMIPAACCSDLSPDRRLQWISAEEFLDGHARLLVDDEVAGRLSNYSVQQTVSGTTCMVLVRGPVTDEVRVLLARMAVGL